MSQLIAHAVSMEFMRKTRTANFFVAVAPTDFEIASGQFIEIAGHSGSGKSTLLGMLSGLLPPTSGEVLLDEQNLYQLREPDLAAVRNERFGIIPQSNTALQSLTVLQNVLLPAVIAKKPAPEAKARELLGELGLAPLMEEKPEALSGGELRRLAVARALLMDPDFILADEPTAGLDSENIGIVLRMLRQRADSGAAVLIAAHESQVAQYANKVLKMDGAHLSPS